MINKLILCLALFNLSESDLKMRKGSLKTACQYSGQIIEESAKYNISPFIFTSLIWVESRFEKSAASPKKACGLTQILKKYSKYSCEQLKNPLLSIKEGAKNFSYWYGYSKEVEKALQCYNSGYNCNSPTYSKQIIQKAQILKSEYAKVYRQHMEKINE
jgi:soluble lytic murein transglycosylase-like protein